MDKLTIFGATPWGNLGKSINPNASVDEWAETAGFDFNIEAQPAMCYDPNTDKIITYDSKRMLFRSDTQAPLSIVSDKYEIVQPRAVLGFFKELVDQFGFKLHTAGILHNGKRYWALAEVGESFRIFGQDSVHSFVSLATACDGSLATIISPTSLRPVCNNMFNYLIRDMKNNGVVKIRHINEFDKDIAIEKLQTQQFAEFGEHAVEMAKHKLSDKEAVEFLLRVFGDIPDDQIVDEKVIEESASARTVKNVFELYSGTGLGSHLDSAKGTVWGVFNAITEHIDFHRNTRSQDNRLDYSMIGQGQDTKSLAYSHALKLVA